MMDRTIHAETLAHAVRRHLRDPVKVDGSDEAWISAKELRDVLEDNDV